MAAPSKAERDAAVAAVVALAGSAYTAWRQRLRHTLAKRRWAPHGFVAGSAEFAPFLGIYDALVARFGVAADERFAVLEWHDQSAAAAVQCGGPYPPTDGGGSEGGARREGGVQREYRRGRSDPAQEAKAEVYKELGYRQAGMVGEHLPSPVPWSRRRATSSNSSGLTARP